MKRTGLLLGIPEAKLVIGQTSNLSVVVAVNMSSFLLSAVYLAAVLWHW